MGTSDPPREASIVRAIQRHLKGRGWFCWKHHGSGIGLSGMPDLFAVRDGHLLCLEVKRPGRSATPLQAARLAQLSSHGATTGVVHSVDEVRSLLDSLQGVRGSA